MVRATEDSPAREMDEVERDDLLAPRVHEHDVDHADDRAQAKLDDDGRYDVSDDELIEDIDLADLAAMEGPDA